MSAPKTVLVVDDSRVSRMVARQYILTTHPNWIVDEASSGEEAIAKCEEITPDLIVLDVNMPGMGGLTAAERLRKLCPDTLISLLTANVQTATRQRAIELGVGFVEKPITQERIDILISQIGAP